MIQLVSALVFACVTASGAPESLAITVFEAGDAGDLPDTAQVASGSGPLDAIVGSIVGLHDRDMFQIVIEAPEVFSASTNNLGTNLNAPDPETRNETQLFLFDENGFGVLANDDDPDDLETFLSSIPVGSLNGPAGIYFLAISVWEYDPESVTGEIFPDIPENGVFGPTGPGGADPISGWGGGAFAQSGSYRIGLTGASRVPEPQGALVRALAVVLTLWWLKKQSTSMGFSGRSDLFER